MISNNNTNNKKLKKKSLQSENRVEKGGLSGKPIKQKALETLRFIYEKTNGAIPIIGVGGISDAKGMKKKKWETKFTNYKILFCRCIRKNQSRFEWINN